MLIQIGMTAPTEPAAPIIKEMVALLGRRRSLRISRKAFLVFWGRLRRRLELTTEYQSFRYEVWKRDKGTCVKCGRGTHTVHHKRRVARAPTLALTVSNGELRCDDCHAQTHPKWLQKPRDRAKQAH